MVPSAGRFFLDSLRPAVDEPAAAPFQVSRRFMYIEEIAEAAILRARDVSPLVAQPSCFLRTKSCGFASPPRGGCAPSTIAVAAQATRAGSPAQIRKRLVALQLDCRVNM
jgi:hypothetical protein